VQRFGGDSNESESWASAIRKARVSGAVQVQQTGIAGDEQADLVHHGGPDQEILAYAAQHYDQWNAEFPGKGFDAGGFGENLTVANPDESQCCIGDTLQAGDCVLEISQPRQPCWKLSRRWDLPRLTVLVHVELC
jgi:MOSC domain-containing protein YiiM